MASIRRLGALGAGALLVLGSLLATLPSHADVPTSDVDGGKDHPVLQRFSGSVLVGYAQQDWEQRIFPDASGVTKNGDHFANPQPLEGRITRLFYLAPLDKGPLEVFRNHQQALQAAGFKTTWSCESKEQGCVKAYFALNKNERLRGLSWAKGDLPNMTRASGGRWSLESSISHEGGRMLVGQLKHGGRTLHLLLYTSQAQNAHTRRTATYIEIVEPKAMPTGQVLVDAGALGQGLQTEGKVALYGLFFDTGKSEIKAESQAQLAEMARLLKSDPKLRVFIVGHTDNVGSFESNMALSLARAQSVVAALAKAPHGIEPSRLSAKGAANIAPLASNAEEDGRARNRRVEMVLP